MTSMEKQSSQSKKIRKGDRVVAISGDHKGQSGIVQSCDGERIVVQGLNYRKKHFKPQRGSPEGSKGKIIDIEQPIHVSNLKLILDGDIAVKLKVSTTQNGSRQFVYQKEGKEVVYRQVKKPK